MGTHRHLPQPIAALAHPRWNVHVPCGRCESRRRGNPHPNLWQHWENHERMDACEERCGVCYRRIRDSRLRGQMLWIPMQLSRISRTCQDSWSKVDKETKPLVENERHKVQDPVN